MSRNSLIDFIRSILIILVILVHIVHWGSIHPNVKSMILAFLMPTFLVVTGFLVNIAKSTFQYTFFTQSLQCFPNIQQLILVLITREVYMQSLLLYYVTGSLLLAEFLDVSHCSYIFGRRTILR